MSSDHHDHKQILSFVCTGRRSQHEHSISKYIEMRTLLSCTLARQYRSASRRFLATVADEPCTSQTIIEKVVQKYAVGLPEGKIVKAGDYVMIRPEHVMTHDNTGPVVSKCVGCPSIRFFRS